MKKYFSQLRPLERRLVVGVGVVLFVVLNWAFIWPHFSDYSNYRNRLGDAQTKLSRWQALVAQTSDFQKQLAKFQLEGGDVPQIDEGVSIMRTIQTQSAKSGVQLENVTTPITHTNDEFFVEQVQNINVLAPEPELVDFLYELGVGSSMIRVRDLSLQPDPPRQRLSANVRLVASFKKNPTATAAKNATPTAK